MSVYPENQPTFNYKTFTIDEVKTALVNAMDNNLSFNECVGACGNEARGDTIYPHYQAVLNERNTLNSISCLNKTEEQFKAELSVAQYINVNTWYSKLLESNNVNSFSELQSKVAESVNNEQN